MEKEIEFAIQCETQTDAGNGILVKMLSHNFVETDCGERGLNFWPAFNVDSSYAALFALRKLENPRFDVSVSEPREHTGTTLVVSVMIREL